MPAMVLRDWALTTAGLLNPRLGGGPVYPYQPSGVWESLAITKERDFTYPASSGADLYRRSLYTFWRRTVGPANMFDAANRQACRVRASITSTPLHALTMLNDPTWVEAARMLASRAMEQRAGVTTEQLQWAFCRVLCREPTAEELERLLAAWRQQQQFYEAHPAAAQEWLRVGATPVDPELDPVAWAAVGNVCLGIFNLDEAMTRQ
jgi:hypothetical protein